MAEIIEVSVSGLKELQANLKKFTSEQDLGKACKAALQAAGRITAKAGKANAGARGYNLTGMRVIDGRHVKRYGRIPRSIKVNRAYKPESNSSGDVYRANVVARGQRQKGIRKNAAPHAHFMEYGYTHWRTGVRLKGFAFLGPALDSTASAAIEAMAASVSRSVDRMQFPTTGKP